MSKAMNLVNEEAIQKCIEYINSADNASIFLEMMKELKVSAEPTEVVQDARSGLNRQMYTIKLQRAKARMSFKFYDSIHAFEVKEKLDLYSVMACIGAEINHPETFEEFCSEFGYDPEGMSETANSEKITTKKLFRIVQQQTKNLKKVIKEEELYCFPS